jgi:alpha-2-macroglobulin
MQLLRTAALATTLALAGQTPSPLRVMRSAPVSPADPGDVITVMFDRPVAGGLESTVEASAVFSISPDLEGRVEWRDPLTLRFTPSAPLRPEAEYTVTIASGVRAMDGSELARPFSWTFRVASPRVLASSPIHIHQLAQYLTPDPTFTLLLSGAVDPRVFERTSAVRMGPACGNREIGLRVVDQRRIGEGDPGFFRWTGYRGPWPQDTLRDLRRVIDVQPAEPLPLDCDGIVRVPLEVSAAPDSIQQYRIRTYGPLRMERVVCGGDSRWCATGPVVVHFSTPVSGAEVQRHVRIAPDLEYTVRDTTEESPRWELTARLAPRSYYAVHIESGMRDIFGQQIGGTMTRATRTTGYMPTVAYDFGRLLVERNGLRTLPVQHVNVDTLTVTTVAIPDSLEGEFLARNWNWEEPWAALLQTADRRRVGVQSGIDDRRVSGLQLPLSSGGDNAATLYAVQVGSPFVDSISRGRRPIALVQVTDLAVHAKIGADEGRVWVTGVTDGQPRADVGVTLHDALGNVRATGRTDAEGLARLSGYRSHADDPCVRYEWCDFEGYVSAETADDRALVGLNTWDPDLAPWRFGINAAWGEQRASFAAAVFTERGIYRPGETVRAKAIVREGALGSLTVPRGDSIRWLFRDRDGGTARDTILTVGEFGTADESFTVAADAPLGAYSVEVQRVRAGEWRTVSSAGYQVAEYRPPEFLVEVEADRSPRLAGDTIEATVSARYLFGAPMSNSPVQYVVLERPLSPWEIRIPGLDAFTVGRRLNWWEEQSEGQRGRESGTDTLDATGHLDLRVPLAAPEGGRGASVSIQAMVTDANRQVVTANTSVIVHPAAFYIGARVTGDRWFWRAEEPVRIEVVTADPNGTRVSGVDVRGTIVRREWHRVRRMRGGQVEEVGSWVSDTVATCNVRTAAEPVDCNFTPPAGGSYTVTFTANDAAGRMAETSFPRWASGAGWVPWYDETQLRMDVIPDRERYAPGDTATILFASPYTDAEAWITVERERVIESRRVRISDGATTLRLPITEAYAPNAFVSIVVVKGRTAEPGPLDDPGRPALRVGYAQLRVTPEVKRLAVTVEPQGDQAAGPSASPVEYQPGDTARIALRVTDVEGRGRRAEVTLWAVDLGVLALTGYRTPDPIDLLYATRGVGVRLASNLVRVAAQIPEGQKGNREAGGGGGGDDAGILRSQFQTTAFFLGSVVTDENGEAIATAGLPDNLTTFRVMAVAVTDGDRYGSGDAEILVTRPLVARPSLPRFLREGDRFAAGVLVNHRMGGTPSVDVRAQADNIRLDGSRSRKQDLEQGRGREFRFDFIGQRDRAMPLDRIAPDSAWFRFDATAQREADAVRVGIPYRVAWHPLAGTLTGILRDTATVDFELHDDIDARRSTLTLSVGGSALGFINGVRMDLRMYPYYCTEQVASVALPSIALVRAARERAGIDTLAAAPTARDAVRSILRRQTPEGGIGYWSAVDWTTPWLSAYSGRTLLAAREAGLAVDSAALARLADYLERKLVDDEVLRVPVAWWHGEESARLSERLSAADFLSRYGRPNLPVENALLANVARMRWEDRLVLAQVLARRNVMQPAMSLLDAAWSGVRVEGRSAVLPEAAYADHYFRSRVRPAAILLQATAQIQPDHPLLGALAATLVERGRAAEARPWNTQDYGWAVMALVDFERVREARGPANVRVRAGRRTVLEGAVEGDAPRDTVIPLDGLVREVDGRRIVRLDMQSGGGQPYWYATVSEVPNDLQTIAVDRGIRVERWYENVANGRPTVTAREGELVRVRLRVSIDSEKRFLVLDDPLPAGLEAVDLSLRTLAGVAAFAASNPDQLNEAQWEGGWYYGSWDSGFWSPFDHKELRDDRVVYSATLLWPGTYSVSYLARATTPGTFIAPPVHAEEMYDPGVNGRTAATRFIVEPASR